MSQPFNSVVTADEIKEFLEIIDSTSINLELWLSDVLKLLLFLGVDPYITGANSEVVEYHTADVVLGYDADCFNDLPPEPSTFTICTFHPIIELLYIKQADLNLLRNKGLITESGDQIDIEADITDLLIESGTPADYPNFVDNCDVCFLPAGSSLEFQKYINSKYHHLYEKTTLEVRYIAGYSKTLGLKNDILNILKYIYLLYGSSFTFNLNQAQIGGIKTEQSDDTKIEYFDQGEVKNGYTSTFSSIPALWRILQRYIKN